MFGKIMLSIIIITSATIIGQMLGFRYTQRVQQLKSLYVSFQLLETEVFYASTPLPIAMQKVGKKSNRGIGKIFIDTHRLLRSRMGYSIEEAWNQSIEDNFSHTALHTEDLDMIIDFGKNLGATDRENQMKNFKLIYLQLEKQQKVAEELKSKNGRMCKRMGILIGIAIVIVFV